ncbi:hypothetical protein [Caballeronia cordobensis]|uniref:hypothetical protein n=1 Tax=Caballeronia cordobensis TaxID=1353886 RepID=UPI00045EE237|nr:NAD-dependent epimerase/dehydratase [Burkholderia sp. RPE67]
MLDIARRIIELTGLSSEIVFKPLPMDDPWHRQPDIALALEAPGWSPTTSLDNGLLRTAQRLREVIEASKCATLRAARRSRKHPGAPSKCVLLRDKACTDGLHAR